MKDLFFIATFLFFLSFTGSLFALESKNKESTVSNEQQNSEQKMIKPNDVLLAEMNEEERGWYKKFQEGMMFFDGWKQISSDILKEISDEKKEEIKPLLETLGVRMGTEWARDNDIRKIDTSNLKDWGKRMKKAKKEGEEKIFSTVKTIYKEVEDRLLQ